MRCAYQGYGIDEVDLGESETYWVVTEEACKDLGSAGRFVWQRYSDNPEYGTCTVFRDAPSSGGGGTPGKSGPVAANDGRNAVAAVVLAAGAVAVIWWLMR